MFNFTVMNQALSDVNVSDKEFRMLYLFANNTSLNNTGDIVMYNGFLMDKLNLSERQVQRLTKSLVDKGYLTKMIKGTSINKNGNVYRLNLINAETVSDKNVTPYNTETNSDTVSDITCDKSCDKNVTPYNSTKINKNIYVYKDHEHEVKDTYTEGEVTDKVETISVQVEEDTNAETNTTSVRSQIDDNSVEVKEATAKVKLSHDELTKRNDYISAVYRKVDERLNYLYTLKTYSLYVDVVDEIAKIISAAQEHRDWFTEPQWDKLTRYCERFVKLTEAKDNYFNGTMKRGADANTTSTDDNAAGADFNDSSVDNTNNNPVPAPTDWAKVGEWVVNSMAQFPTYEAWQKELDRILNKKFGDGWESAEYRIMAQASAIYNRCTKTAIQHYTSIENAQKATPTPTEEDADLAPWEMEKEDTVAEIYPTLDGYLTPSIEDAPQAPQVAPESISVAEPTNYPTESNEALRSNLYASDEVEPDEEDYAFDEYISMTTANRSTANYGYAYGA